MSRKIKLTITLPESVWAEVYYAVQSKISTVSQGDYAPEDTPGDDEKWLVDLAYAQSTLTTAFGINNVEY